ncbi:MAG: carboxypeptidase regulatory-like domain-containing protein [Acidobacteria bacterium]|nr:carboxypeptidase regulatory-like domain-containing protein [Acidobacteriota bacterium]MBI3424490.1 carboxypeptidase regulatory-like domain-containing protein [Acidobacteriota bacterium]
MAVRLFSSLFQPRPLPARLWRGALLFACALLIFAFQQSSQSASAGSATGKKKPRETAVNVCGQILSYTPATSTTPGSLRINNTTYALAPGIVIGGQALIAVNAVLCFDLTFDNAGQVTLPSAVTGSVVTLCGGLEEYQAATFNAPGVLKIAGQSFQIMTDTTIKSEASLVAGANICLTATRNAQGQIVTPSAAIVNLPKQLAVCGNVNAYTAATSNTQGLLNLGGIFLTTAPGTTIGGLSVGQNQCMLLFQDAFGRVINPASAAPNGDGKLRVCGVVSEYRKSDLSNAGFIRIAGAAFPIAANNIITDGNLIQPGVDACLELVLVNGQIANGSAVKNGIGECPQITVPTVVHGTINDTNEDDTFFLPQLSVFTVSASNASGVGVLPLSGVLNQFGLSNVKGLTASAPNTTVTALSCSDSFWDFIFALSAKGATDGDMVKLYLQSPNSANPQVIAMFTVQNGGFVINSVNPFVSLYVSGNGLSPGYFIPSLLSLGNAGIFTPPITIIFSMDRRTPLDGCFQLGIDLKRTGGAGMLSFVPLQTVVKRLPNTVADGTGMQTGGLGVYPTGKPCGAVCTPCNQLPPPVSLAGFAYCDSNNDGIKQAGEVGLAGVTVKLTGTDTNGAVSLTTTTDANGAYSFNTLKPGTYAITETQPAGYVDGLDAVGTLGGTLGNDVISNIQVSTTSGADYNFGESCNGSLSGFVYCDGNNDGVKQAGEAGLQGVTITLTGTTAQGNVNLTMATDGNGAFVFGNLQPGTYTVTETQPAGYADGKDAVGTLGGTLANDAISAINVNNAVGQNYNFGEGCNGGLSGFVYCDGNGDGLKQAGEPGIAGVKVTLTGTNAQGPVNAMATTDANGAYSFINLQPGTYTLTETQPAGYADGLDAVGSLGGTLANDAISAIVLNNNGNGINYNFGEGCNGGLSGFVYCDTNNDGVKQAGEGGVPGVTIQLMGTDSQGPVNLSTATDASGSYSFSNLRPGTYTIKELQPAGFTDGLDAVGSLGGTLANDQISNITLPQNGVGVNYNFGEGCLGSLSGFVYCDYNGDGLKQGNENGIAGVAITLTGTDANGAVNRLAISNATGAYTFPNLLPGTYKLTETQPPGNVDGADMAGSLGGVVTNDMIANINVNANIGVDYNFGEQCMPIKCDTICFRDARDWLFRLNRLPNGTLIIMGFNFNNPVSIQRNVQAIQNALQSGITPMQQLNREFIAVQLNLANAGGTSSPVVFNSYWSPLRCSGLNFTPVTLTNGFVFTPETLLNDLMLQVQAAIRENRSADFQALANLLAQLNGRC